MYCQPRKRARAALGVDNTGKYIDIDIIYGSVVRH